MRALAAELTRYHVHTTHSEDGDKVVGVEQPLILQLEEAVAGSSSRSNPGAGGDPATRAPIDPAALDLYEQIRAWVPVSPVARGGDLGELAPQAGSWLDAMTDEEYAKVEPELVQWVAAIRSHLDPAKEIPLRSVACRVCGHTHVDLPSGLNAAVVAVPEQGQPYAYCRVCETRYDGSALKTLGSVQ